MTIININETNIKGNFGITEINMSSEKSRTTLAASYIKYTMYTIPIKYPMHFPQILGMHVIIL